MGRPFKPTHRGHNNHVDGIPPVWGNVPPRNPNFTGRVHLLERLTRRVMTDPVVLLGMGGIGKTLTAVEYIYRRLREYDIVWWIQASQPAQIRAAFTELAQFLRLPESTESHTAIPAVREALRLGQPFGRWLLVFDSAARPEIVHPFFPRGGPGEILITSRNTDWSHYARTLKVSVFTREESAELLRRWDPEIDDHDADQLSERLLDLPLAIEQAGVWRAETGMPVHEYLRLFDEKAAEIRDTAAPDDYALSVAAAWNVSFDELRTRNPAAHQLLQVCAFFAPEPISRSLFTGVRGVSISPELDTALRDPMQLSRAIRDINRYGLAKIDHRRNTLLLHRLVQLVLRNRMSPDDRAAMKHGTHVLLANFDPNDPYSSKERPRYQVLLPHVSVSGLVKCSDAWVRQLVLNLSQYLYHWGDHDEAATLAKQALDEWSDCDGETNRYAMEAASHLGLFLWALSRYPEATDINRRTLELRRQVSGENAEETILAELRVTVDMKARGQFRAAKELNEQIHEKAVSWYGKDDPITLATAHDLAVTVRLCGNYRRAYELDDYTYQRRAEVLGHDNMDTLNTLSGLLLDVRELGDYRRARLEHEQIVERVREILGEGKAGTLRRARHLAVARRKDGDHAAALVLSTQTLQLYRRWYGNDHPDTMACAVANSIDLREAGNLEAAYRLGEQTYDRYRGKLGDHHPYSLAAAVDLGVTLRLLGNTSRARRLTEQSLEHFCRVLGPDHPHAVICGIDLASNLTALGEVEAAVAQGKKALALSIKALGADHPTTLAANINLELDLRRIGQQADVEYAGALERYRVAIGENHPLAIAAANGMRANCDIDPLPG
jgi:tetratricopeptide (TPR) repeat protein